MPADAATDLAADKPKIRFIQELAWTGFHCGRKGQTGHVTKIQEDGTLVLVLACGHVIYMEPGVVDKYLEITGLEDFVRRSRPSKEEGEQMAKTNKTTKISNVNGVVPIQTDSDRVKKVSTKHRFYKALVEELDEDKTYFRQKALETAKNTEGDVFTVEFISDDPSAVVPVSIPDIEKDANRTKLTAATYKKAIKLGFDVDNLDVTRAETTVTLSGDWAQWFLSMINSEYREAGKDVPNEDQIAENEKISLTVEGIARLEAMAESGTTQQERDLAELLLASGIKSPTVAIK